MKAFLTKKPDKPLYDLGEKVELTCTLDHRNGELSSPDLLNYSYKLYKLGSRKTARTVHGGKVELLINALTTKTEGTYMCVAKRPKVNYYSFQSVKVIIRGKLI